MICRLLNEGQGCVKLNMVGRCGVYSRGGMNFRNRHGYCPVVDDGPNKRVIKAPAGKKRSGQQKQKKA